MIKVNGTAQKFGPIAREPRRCTICKQKIQLDEARYYTHKGCADKTRWGHGRQEYGTIDIYGGQVTSRQHRMPRG